MTSLLKNTVFSWIVAAVVGLLAILFFTRGRDTNTKLEQVIAQSKQFEKERDSLTKVVRLAAANSQRLIAESRNTQKRMDSITVANTALESRVASLRGTSRTLVASLKDTARIKNVRDSVNMLVTKIVPYKDSVISATDSLLVAEKVKNELCETDNKNLTMVVEDQSKVITSQAILLEKAPLVKKSDSPDRALWGLVKLPSRKTTLITGAVLGAVTTAIFTTDVGYRLNIRR